MNQVTKNTLTTVGGAFVLISFVNIISRGLGFFREVLFANYFGVNIEFDVYLVGAAIPVTLNTIILYIGQNYFIPAFNKNNSETRLASNSFTNLNIIIAASAGLLVSLLFFIYSSEIISLFVESGNSNLFEVTNNIFKIFLISIPLNSIISILIANEQAKLKFTHPALSVLWLNITLIPVLIVFTDRLGIYTIPIGFVLGILLQLIYLILTVSHKFKLNLRHHFPFHKLKGLIDSTIISVILIEAISQLYLLADRYFFNQVQDGGISALNYASNLYLLPISIFAVALSTVIFPQFSKAVSDNKIVVFNNLLNDSFSAILLIFIPITFTLFFYGDGIITLLFERGKFNHQGTQMTFEVLKFYTLSLVFYASYALLNKVLYSSRKHNLLLVITIVGLLVKIALNSILVTNLKQEGLAMSTSISYFFFFITSFFIVHYNLKIKILKYYFVNFIFIVVLVSTSFLLSDYLSSLLFVSNNLMKLFIFVLFYSSFIMKIKPNVVYELGVLLKSKFRKDANILKCS